MHDPIRHVVIDANILSAYLHPGSVSSSHVRDRSSILLEAAISSQWPGLRLYTPSICIAEALGVLDKYRFCTWHGPLKNDPTRRMKRKDYESSRDKLAQAVKERVIEQLSHDPSHVLLAGLVSPINNNLQIRRRDRGTKKASQRVKPPMGAADCLISGMTIHLVNRLGRDSVVLATADQRMADVLCKARKLRSTTAEKLGLPTVALQAGLEWSSDLYPNAINLNRASDADMQATFGGWPLPTTPLTYKTRKQLTKSGSRSRLYASRDGAGWAVRWARSAV